MSSIPKSKPLSQRFTNREKALYRAKSTLAVGLKLQAGALETGNAACLALADMIIESARPENVFTATDLHDRNGELYTGYGSLNCASSRLDPAYAEKRSNQAKRAVTAAMEGARRGNDLQMLITFTMPTLIGFGFRRTFEVFDYAWSLMRKRKWFKEHINAACCSEEFTLGDEDKLKDEGREWTFESDGYHVHKHILCYSKRMDTQILRAEWTTCLIASASRSGLDLQFATSDGYAVVNRKSAYGDKAVDEVSKYICKGDVFEKIPVNQICEVEETLRGRRLMSTFGLCNKNKGSRKKDATLHVHKKSITDGETANSLAPSKAKTESLRAIGKKLIEEGRRLEWLLHLKASFSRRRNWRIQQLLELYPFATLENLAGEKFYGEHTNFGLVAMAVAA